MAGELPDGLKFFDGGEVKSAADWERRRAELKQWFGENVYGVYPDGAEEGFTHEILSETRIDNVIRRRVMLRRGGFGCEFSLFLPVGAVRPPAIIYAILRAYREKFDLGKPYEYSVLPSDTTLPIAYLAERGFAVAAYQTDDVARDEKGGDLTGLNAELIGPNRTDNSAGALTAWSFFARRIADYLISDGTVAPEKIGIAGHSRGGKTALLTAAMDERFAFAAVSNSGCCGAAIARGNTGEKIRDIYENFPYWFAPAYARYIDREDEMPVDFHELVELVAPRLAYVTSSSADGWACPPNELRSCREASAVYEKIYGTKGLVAPAEVRLDAAYGEGNIGYHIKTGKHSFDFSDWEKVADFLSKKLDGVRK